MDAVLDNARALLRSRRLDEALAVCSSILEKQPRQAAAWFLQGVALAEKGQLCAAASSIASAFEFEPVQAAGNHLVFANVLLEVGDAKRAEEQARLALASVANWPPALVALAIAQSRQGRHASALESAQRAAALDAGYLRAYSALAAILAELGRYPDAMSVVNEGLKRWPQQVALSRLLAEIMRREGRQLHDQSRVFDALDRYRAALSIDDSNADWWNDLGNAYADAALLAEAREAYRKALERRPTFHQVESNLLVNLHYDPEFDAEAMFRAHVAWAAHHAQGVERFFGGRRAPDLAAGSKLRVAFVSPALHEGPTAVFLAPLLEHLDRARFEIHAYQTHGIVDPASERIRSRCHAWHDVRTRTDAEIARKIAEDAIHILVDLAGHCPGGRLLVLARKPAPVVATWLDYFDTTGLATVDCLVSDAVSTPPERCQRFTERVELLEPSRLCYRAPDDAPPVAQAPALRNGYVTFGSFNRLSKHAGPVIELWSEVLRTSPAARLIVKNGALIDERMREELARRFESHGVSRERLEMRAHSPHAEMLREYGDVDIALDPFPYNGGLTTCEALWMGVPVITLRGDSMISRQGASLLSAAGLREWVAGGRTDFVSLAIGWASDVAALQALRGELRPRLASSALLDGARFGRQFGAALERMWESREA